jgi:type I restriction enzyme S subunit
LKNLQVESAFQSIPIKKVAIEEQTAIATTLSTIESKMALNRQINDNLPIPGHSSTKAITRLAV